MPRHQDWLEFRVGIEIDWISEFGRYLLCFFCGGSNFDRFWCGWSKLTWFQCRESNLTRFQCRDRNWLCWCVGVEIYWILVSRSKLTWFCVGASKLISCWSEGPNMNMISVLGRSQLEFCIGEGISLSFTVGGSSWLDCGVGDWTWLDFSVGGENRLVLVRASKLTWCLCGWSKLTWFQSGGWNLTWLHCRNGIDLVVVCVGDIDLISVKGSEWTWFLCARRKMSNFSVWIEISLVFVSGHWKWFDVSGGVEINVPVVRGIEVDLVIGDGIRNDVFVLGVEIDYVQAEIDLFLVWVVEIGLVFGCGPQIPWF